MESYDILVIMLSVLLLIFLTTSIVLTVMVIKLVSKARNATSILEKSAEDIHQFTSKLKTVGDVSAIGSAIAQFSKVFKKGDKK